MKLAMTAMLALAAAGTAPSASWAQRMVQGGPGANFPRPMAGQMPMARPPMQGQVQHQAQFQQQFQRQNQFQQQHQFQQQQQDQFQRQNQFGQTRVVQNGGGRWGSKVGGRWWGGANAPGGWGAYRSPQRGWRLPSYWVAPRFYINDWSNYGFSAPSQGYYWTRYYDDAVLIDGRGDVYDTVSGVDWDHYDGTYDARYDDRGAAYYDDGCYDERVDRKRRDRKGVGGAVAGAVVGGIAGNVIAGRGNRLGGTLIGGGLGAAAGYAIGSRDDGRRGCAPLYDGGYREPLPPPPPPPPVYDDRGYDHGPRRWTSADGATTVTVTTGGGAPVVYAPPAYGYGNVTTVTVQTAPVVTTTTTEIVEDHVTWTRPKVRHVYKRAWRPTGKTLCRCR